LYETARFVDIYKNYHAISEERKLDADERNEQKKYQRLADVFTPLLKLIASEYSNQIAYDALQVHGGAGFMKDFPIERIYRDARITSIYEGTSQLQVVAAIRGVTSGAYLNHIREAYQSATYAPEMEYLKTWLTEMTDEFEKCTAHVAAAGSTELMDFHARRLVEMAGNIIMGYLLLNDSLRDHSYLGRRFHFYQQRKSMEPGKGRLCQQF
jgi:3-(methylthio)propanoyl-CoA dehydrogenase